MQVHIQTTSAMILIEDGHISVYLLILLSVFKSSANIEIQQIPTRNTELGKDAPSSFFLIITQNGKIVYIKKNSLYCVN